MLLLPRRQLLPFEYGICEDFCDAINQSFWVHTEWNFIQDIHEFNNILTENERQVVKRAMLAISQVEVAVKLFWGDIIKAIPKPEVGMVGATFAESEVRHLRAYSRLLDILGLSEEFEKIMEVPCIKGRLDYLQKYAIYANGPNRNFLKSLVLFSLFVENVSLFGQFFIIVSFKKEKNLLHDLAKVVNATAQEENLHAQFGVFLINTLRDEYPELWTDDLVGEIIDFTYKAREAERGVISWILESDTFLSKDEVFDFLDNRFNISLFSISIPPKFKVKNLERFSWYDDLVTTSIHSDFFTGRPNTYALKNKPITANDLF